MSERIRRTTLDGWDNIKDEKSGNMRAGRGGSGVAATEHSAAGDVSNSQDVVRAGPLVYDRTFGVLPQEVAKEWRKSPPKRRQSRRQRRKVPPPRSLAASSTGGSDGASGVPSDRGGTGDASNTSENTATSAPRHSAVHALPILSPVASAAAPSAAPPLLGLAGDQTDASSAAAETGGSGDGEDDGEDRGADIIPLGTVVLERETGRRGTVVAQIGDEALRVHFEDVVDGGNDEFVFSENVVAQLPEEGHGPAGASAGSAAKKRARAVRRRGRADSFTSSDHGDEVARTPQERPAEATGDGLTRGDAGTSVGVGSRDDIAVRAGSGSDGEGLMSPIMTPSKAPPSPPLTPLSPSQTDIAREAAAAAVRALLDGGKDDGSKARSRRVRFDHVEWREYPRALAGDASVPSSGSWALGLGWSSDVEDGSASESGSATGTAGPDVAAEPAATRSKRRGKGAKSKKQKGAPPPPAVKGSAAKVLNEPSVGVDEFERRRQAELAERLERLPPEERALFTPSNDSSAADAELETRQFTHRKGVPKNPLFEPLNEKERRRILVQALSASASASDGAAGDGKGHGHESAGMPHRRGSARAADAAQHQNSREAEDLAALRRHRSAESGCSCKPPAKMTASQLKNEIRARTGRSIKAGKKVALLEKLVAELPGGEDALHSTCTPMPAGAGRDFKRFSHVCECAAAGVACHQDVCHCAATGGCANPAGCYKYSKSTVLAHVRSMISAAQEGAAAVVGRTTAVAT